MLIAAVCFPPLLPPPVPFGLMALVGAFIFGWCCWGIVTSSPTEAR
jgi:hypothetical protein